MKCRVDCMASNFHDAVACIRRWSHVALPVWLLRLQQVKVASSGHCKSTAASPLQLYMRTWSLDNPRVDPSGLGCAESTWARLRTHWDTYNS